MGGLSFFLALVLAGSAGHKALAHERMALAAARLLGLRASLGILALIAAGVVEGAAALCLLVPALHGAGVAMAVALWAVYAIALARHRGETLDCGCDLVARSRKIGAAHILRPAALALLALIPSTPFDITALFAGLGLLALYVALGELLSIPHPAWRHS
jgi:hypothetical protein